MRDSTGKYDTTLAVVAIRTLLLEPNNEDDRNALAWQPTDQFLENCAVHSPEIITCFSGELLPYPIPNVSTGHFITVYAIDASGIIAYLGHALTPRALADHEPYKTKSRDIDRTRCFCIMPLDSEVVDQTALTEAIQRYFKKFAPKLLRASIVWLDQREGLRLNQEILDQAKQTKQPAPKSEFLKKIAEDQGYI